MNHQDLTSLELRTVHKRSASSDTSPTPISSFSTAESSGARALGIIVHGILERMIGSQSISPNTLIRKAFAEVPEFDFEKLPHLYERAQQIVDHLAKSSAWKSINDHAIKFHPELRYYSRVGDFLSQGQMDLVIEKNNELWVIDYKTSPSDANSNTSEISDGQTFDEYRSQVERYVRICRQIFPGFTKYRGFLCWVIQAELEEVFL